MYNKKLLNNFFNKNHLISNISPCPEHIFMPGFMIFDNLKSDSSSSFSEPPSRSHLPQPFKKTVSPVNI